MNTKAEQPEETTAEITYPPREEERIQPTAWFEAVCMVVGDFLLTIEWVTRSASEPVTGIVEIRVRDFLGVHGSQTFQWSGTLAEAKAAAIFALQHKRPPSPEDTLPDVSTG